MANLLGFNCKKTQVTQYAKQLIENGELLYGRAEHYEDFFSCPKNKTTWRTRGKENGTMGDLAPHILFTWSN